MPVEPTAEMINVGQDQEFTVDVYAAMLAAAPTPPQPIYDEAVAEAIESTIFRLETFIEAEREMPIPSMEVLLDAFKRVAQSRAKSVEVGDE